MLGQKEAYCPGCISIYNVVMISSVNTALKFQKSFNGYFNIIFQEKTICIVYIYLISLHHTNFVHYCSNFWSREEQFGVSYAFT